MVLGSFTSDDLGGRRRSKLVPPLEEMSCQMTRAG
jgi:hypothetical protein